MEVFPNYYKEFKCIADKCKHSCCIGWEIDIDESSLSFYNSLDSQIGKRIRQNIEGETPHFVLTEEERCPFLNQYGLCDIITECGEDALCDICRLHPRFSNYYSDFHETGLGLCCEEASRIIILNKEKFSIIFPDGLTVTGEEKSFFDIRNNVFSILQNRKKTIRERFDSLSKVFGFEFSFSLSKLCDIYLSLERLDEKWTFMLDDLKQYCLDDSVFENSELQIPFEQLSCYFVFRHMSDALWYGDYAQRVAFTLMSCYLIGALWSEYIDANGSIKQEDIIEIVRIYSSEVEYSEDNMERLLCHCKDTIVSDVLSI